MHKGIDQKFVHYGIRREDLALIAAICDKNEIDFEWMSEHILRAHLSNHQQINILTKKQIKSRGVISQKVLSRATL